MALLNAFPALIEAILNPLCAVLVKVSDHTVSPLLVVFMSAVTS